MINGFILINKEVGLTSRKVCNKISFLFNQKKVGHIGTLDPFAEGLLIVCINKATKAGAFIDEGFKTYRATIKLGVETDSLDCTGNIISTKSIPQLDKNTIERILNSFIGEIEQTVPITSAVHVNGKRLYEYAHKGQEVELPKRKQIIKTIELISFTEDTIEFETTVNRGTYIRSLGSDIAQKLGTVGHLIKLVRTQVGPFKLKDAVKLDEVKESSICDIYSILSKCCDTLMVDQKLENDIKNGKVQFINYESTNKNLLIINKDKQPIAMYIKSDDQYRFQRGLF